RERFGGLANGVFSFPELGVRPAVMSQDGGGLFRGPLAGSGASRLNDGLRHTEIEWIVRSGEIKAEMSEKKVLAVMLLQVEADGAAVGSHDGVFEFKGCGMPLNGWRTADSPSIPASEHFAIDGLVYGEIVLRKISAGVSEFGRGIRQVRSGPP